MQTVVRPLIGWVVFCVLLLSFVSSSLNTANVSAEDFWTVNVLSLHGVCSLGDCGAWPNKSSASAI